MQRQFWGSLSTYYTQEVIPWLRNNPRRIVIRCQISKLLGIAYCKTVILQNTVTQVLLTNRKAFTDLGFAATVTTDRQ